MKERPILFSGEMVRAILDGRKTQTRRAVKSPVYADPIRHMEGGAFFNCVNGEEHWVRCPYGIAHDRLWVRETWREWGGTKKRVAYRATDDIQRPADGWKPSIFMPRKYSRITLEIIDVRVERLGTISRGDAMAEGCPFPNIATSDDPRHWYADLWEKINGKGSWAANPWVWVLEFKTNMPNAVVIGRCAPNENQ